MFKHGLGKKLILLLIILIIFAFLGGQAFTESVQYTGVIVTAPAGGSYFALGSGFSQVLADKQNMKIQVQVTNGEVQNAILVGSEDAELGFSGSPTLLSAWNGTDWAKKEYKDLRLIAPLNFVIFQVFSIKGSGINSVYDLEGKKIVAGEAGSSHDLHGRAILDTLGIKPAKIYNLPKQDATGNLRDGLVDASVMVTAIPNSAIIELEATHDIVMVTLSEEDIEKVVKKYKYFIPCTIPKGSYKAATEDSKTVKVANNIITHKDVPAEIIYQVTKAWFDNIDTLIMSHPSAKDSVPEDIIYGVIPLHEGAYKYYKEIGLDVEDLKPPEAK